MLTDDEIRDLLENCQNGDWDDEDVRFSPGIVAELCTRVLASEARVKALETEGAQLAANQCHNGYGDEWGNHRCRVQDELAARVSRLEEALHWINEYCDEDEVELNTIQARARAALEAGTKAPQ